MIHKNNEKRMDWTARIKQGLEFPGKFLANGGHAQQAIPAQHRILNAGVMGLGWFTLNKLRHYVFGFEQKSEGEFVEVKREDVPAPLRFLHKTIDWDPHSEEPEQQWKKVAYQLFPAVGAGLGAVGGSMMAFELNGRAQTYKNHTQAKSLNIMDADSAAQYSQALPLRVLTAFFGTFSSASGLTFLYGLLLNSSFAAANGARIFTGSLAKGNMGPAKALEAQLGSIASYVKEAAKSGGEVSDAWGKQFVDRVLEPLFGHELQTAEAQERARATIQKIVKDSYHKFQTNGESVEKIAKAVTDDLTKKLGKDHIGEVLLKEFQLDPAHATLGNANPVWRAPVKTAQDALGVKNSVSGFQEKLRKHAAMQPAGTSL